jgi:hypothetical protein
MGPFFGLTVICSEDGARLMIAGKALGTGDLVACPTKPNAPNWAEMPNCCYWRLGLSPTTGSPRREAERSRP